MKITPKISVIVPIYNVEKYLNQCIESIINQSFTDFELILVDDGSPDNCPQICDEWAKKDSRVKVIHKVNGGVAHARISGVQIVTGEYVTFVDSDDWVEQDFLKILYNSIIDNNCDIVQCNFRVVSENSNENIRFLPNVYNKDKIYNVLIKECINDAMYRFSPSLCNKIFKKEIIEQAIITGKSNLTVAEDYLVIFAALCMSDKVVVDDTPEIYNYRFNTSSVTKLYNYRVKYETPVFFQRIKDIAEKFNINTPDYSLRIMSVNMLNIYKCAKSNLTIEEKVTEIKEICTFIDFNQWRLAVKKESSRFKRFGMMIYMPLIINGHIKLAIKVIKLMDRLKG